MPERRMASVCIVFRFASVSSLSLLADISSAVSCAYPEIIVSGVFSS